jgi:putative ABC transport system permease protein
MVLLAVALLLVRSYHNLEDQNLGIRADNTVTARTTLGEHGYTQHRKASSIFSNG